MLSRPGWLAAVSMMIYLTWSSLSHAMPDSTMHDKAMHDKAMPEHAMPDHAMPDHAMQQPGQTRMHNHAMVYNDAGMIMNNNSDNLPLDCKQISRDHEFTIRAGVEYAADFPGTIFGLDQHELRVEPCSRIRITFVNEDQVRHQWMLHGLPKYLYDQGMFTLEAMGGQTQSGTFIVPGDSRTYLIHCDLPQHMEKGMKGQLVVGSGSGDLWSIPGVSREFQQQDYLPGGARLIFVLAALSGIILGLVFFTGSTNSGRRR